jgi:nucleoside-diphosphate-sugar epimerase
MKVIVTGAAGFIGSHLAEELVKRGHQVVGIDCFTDYYPRPIKEANVRNLLKSQNFDFIEKDILELDLVKLLKGVDVVFHEAAQAGVRGSWGANFSTYVKNNILSTQALLEASKKSSLKHFVYASSSSIYGDSETYPTKEDTIPRPISPYGVTKLACEHLCNAYLTGFGLPVVILRYFTVYGPRQRPDMAFNKFIRSMLSEMDIIVYGNGQQTRDFTFVSDIVEANMLVLENEINNGIFNIGGGTTTTINEVIQILQTLNEKDVNVKYQNSEKGDVKHTCADINRAKRVLGFRPTISIKEGLPKEMDWLQTHIDLFGSRIEP